MQIIVNADDFGMTANKNRAIDQLMRKGICTNASLVVNTAYSDEAVRLAYEGGYQDRISLHLNLTEGQALSDDIKKIPLYYEKGAFVHRAIIRQNKQVYPFHIVAVRNEVEAQIQKFIKYGLKIKSIDSHNWVHLRVPVWLALKPLIKKYDIKIVRPMWEGYKRPEIASDKWSKYFTAFQPWLLQCKQCNIIQHTSNIEQFLLYEDEIKKFRYVETFVHPDMINDEIIDISSSYLKHPKQSVENNVSKLSSYPKISIDKLLEAV